MQAQWHLPMNPDTPDTRTRSRKIQFLGKARVLQGEVTADLPHNDTPADSDADDDATVQDTKAANVQDTKSGNWSQLRPLAWLRPLANANGPPPALMYQRPHHGASG